MKPKRSGSVVFLTLGAFGALVLIASPDVAVEAAYPVERVSRGLLGRACSWVGGFFSNGAAAVENVRLRRELAGLQLLKGDVDRLETENARLRRALDFMAHEPEKWLVAEVLSEGGGAAGVRDVIRVGKGSLEGLGGGEIVAVPEGLVGRVTSVTPHTALVTLVTDPSMKVAFDLPNGERGIVSGGGGGLVLRHLSRAADVRAPERIVTSGRGGVYPAGMSVGTLLSVTNGVRGIEGEVRPAVDFETLEDVFIRHAR